MAKVPVRNIGVLGKDGSGKTSLTEAVLFATGAIKEMGSIKKRTTVSDFEDEEQKRGFSLHSAICHTTFKKDKLNLIDTPGFPAFTYDAQSIIKIMDAGLFVVGAGDEISAQARYLCRYALVSNETPMLGVITHLDKESADFDETIKMIEERVGKKPVVLQIPYGIKDEFRGVIDLVRGQLYEYPTDGSGKVTIKPIPEDYVGRYEEARMQMLEEAAMADEALMEKFLEEMDLTPDETAKALKNGFKNAELFPVMIASGPKMIGIDRLLQLLHNILPEEALDTEMKAVNEENEEIIVKEDDKRASAFVVKTIIDPFQGNISVFRVNSGMIKQGSELYNPHTDTFERLGQLYYIQGKELLPVDEVHPGDLVAVAKLKKTYTGNSLCDKKRVVKFPSIIAPEPVIKYAISVATKKDEDKLGGVIKRIKMSDPTIQLIHDSEMHQQVLGGQGQIQMQALLEEVKRKYKLEIHLSSPKVPYRETIKGKSDAQGKYKKQSGGKGQYGDCSIRVKPRDHGEGFNFVDKIVGGAIPRNFIPSVEKGIVDAAKKGVLKGYPMIDFEVELYFGSYHAVDSSDMAFQVAGSMAYKKAMSEAKPVILEPYVNMDIFVEADLVGAVAGDISSRRGRVNGFESFEGEKVVKVTIPQVEVMEYEPILNQLTSGNARFSVDFSHYEEFRGELTEIPTNGKE